MKQQFVIPRISQEETTCAVITISSPYRLTADELFSKIRDSLTEWVLNSADGKHLWIESSRDLNIGDLCTHGIPFWVQANLRHFHEINSLEIECYSYEENHGDWHYDSILVDSSQLSDDD